MAATVAYHGDGPTTAPSAFLTVSVIGNRELSREVWATDTMAVRLVLDDSTEFVVTRGAIPVRGDGPRVVFFGGNLDPARFLELARARDATVKVGTHVFRVPRPRLEEITALYRAALCIPADSLPEPRVIPAGEFRPRRH